MGQFSKVLLAFDNAHTVPQRALDCEPVLGRLNQVYGVTTPLSLCLEYLWKVSVQDTQIEISMIS